MESSTPKPVTFKSLASGEFKTPESSKPSKTLSLQYTDIEYHQLNEKNGFFLLVNQNDPTNSLKLYPAGFKRLCKALPFAFKGVRKLEMQDVIPDDELYNCGTINKHENMHIRLVLTTFMNKVFIWLRLYVLNENNDYLPTKKGVRFSVSDNLQAIENLIPFYMTEK